MEFSIEVDKSDGQLLKDQMEETPPEGLEITFKHRIVKKGLGFPDTLVFTATVAATPMGTIALNVIAQWLYEKLKNGRAQKVTIERTVLEEIDKDKIRRVIYEKIRKG